MNEENIMENNEVLEVEEIEVENTNSGLSWKIIGGALALAGTIYGGLKLRKKIKAKKESEPQLVKTTDEEIVDSEDDTSEETGKKKK